MLNKIRQLYDFLVFFIHLFLRRSLIGCVPDNILLVQEFLSVFSICVTAILASIYSNDTPIQVRLIQVVQQLWHYLLKCDRKKLDKFQKYCMQFEQDRSPGIRKPFSIHIVHNSERHLSSGDFCLLSKVDFLYDRIVGPAMSSINDGDE